MTLWQYYRSLSAQTRLFVGTAMIVYAAGMLYISDVAEKRFDLIPTEEDERRLKEVVPKITIVAKRDR